MAIDEIHESNAQWVDRARRRASALPGADLRQLPGLTIAWGGGAVWLCNSAFLSGPWKDSPTSTRVCARC
jgi:hypothetical protein